MIRLDHRIDRVCAALAIGALLAGSAPARAEKPDEVPAPAHPVIVKNTDPIPITGDVHANIVGTVPVLVENTNPIPMEGSVVVVNPDPIAVEGDVNADVTGTVEVRSFDTRLDDLKYQAGEVRRAVEDLRKPARVPWTWTWGRHQFSDEECLSPAPGRWDGLQLAVISADSDAVRITFHPEENCEGGVAWSLGAEGSDIPTVHPISFAEPTSRFKSIKVKCHNTFTDCEVDVSMVGSTPGP